MEFRFISKKPWVDETLRLRRSLVYTTLTMVVLGIVLAIIGIVLLAYMEFAVGVVAVTFGVLLPVGYLLANALLFMRRRKAYDRSMIIEYKFKDDTLEIIKLSDSYKSKTVVDYDHLGLVKVINKPRYLLLKTKGFFTDMLVIRKSDAVADGDSGEMISNFISFLMSDVVRRKADAEVTCQEEPVDVAVNDEQCDATDSVQVVSNAAVEDNAPREESVTFEDLTAYDEVVDIEDEDDGLELDLANKRYTVDLDEADDPIDSNVTEQ